MMDVAPSPTCDQCGRIGWVRPASAPGKRFCSDQCRSRWWADERARGIERLRRDGKAREFNTPSVKDQTL